MIDPHIPPPADDRPEVKVDQPRPTSTVRTRLHSRSHRASSRLPSWMGSIRFRLTAVWSILVFGLAALVVGGIYLGLQYSLKNQKISAMAFQVGGITFIQPDQAQLVQRAVNERALDALRVYSFWALLALFFLSLVVGWIVSGRLLRPLGEISNSVREIQASDLKQRIDLGGPNDELRQLADTFDDMLGRLDEAFEGQRQFIHEASHELRNPLAVIRTNLEVTLADPDASAEELRHAAEVVERSSERMARLVDDLLVYARKGTLSLERDPVDIALLINEAAEEFTAPASAAGVHLVHQAVGGLWVVGDRLALRQALGNLLANAIRYSPEGTTVRLRGGLEGPWVWLAVEDQGPGIDLVDQDRVFQRFWRGDSREGREQGRSGLGLTIVRQIAEAHGGEVKLVSQVDHGSAFALWLPALAPAQPSPPLLES
ncbi:MAG: HAMP domain-containing protein [Actinobacteria bacterium]|nr:HAMP domain-containing protein [Actinomycetota bacterium]MTA41640.1 HAMP domain-containing protein [Actinomycetota bacterium]